MRPTNVKSSDWIKYNFLFLSEHFLGHRLYQKLFSKTEKRLYESIDKYASTAPAGEPFRVLEYQKEDNVEPFAHPLYPQIFRGAAADWPCTQKWDFDFFSDKFGDREVILTNNVGLVGNEQAKFETIKLRDYISQLRSGSKKYLKFNQMIDDSSNLQDDFDGTWLRKFHWSTKMKNLFFLFMGGKGTATPIHCALPPTVFVQIQGSKKWVLYPANHRLFLGVRPDRRAYYHTHADPSAPPSPEFPLLKHVSKQEVTINPGDVLWFPALVWHQVENTSDSIGVAYKFFHLPYSFYSSKMLTTLFFFSTKPSFLSSIIKSKFEIFTSEQD